MVLFLKDFRSFRSSSLSLRLRGCMVVAALLAVSPIHAQTAPSESPGSSDVMAQFLRDRGVAGFASDAAHAVADLASKLVVHAIGFVGIPYKLGGNTVDMGFDCSGFVRMVFIEMTGRVLPRRAEEQAAATQSIDRSELKPGDLVFFNTLRRSFSHVGIYVGGGRFVHSPRPGGEVRVESMSKAYWATRFDGARRAVE